jgi:non-canonical poly(A) RNA polymerase PAPD5/7
VPTLRDPADETNDLGRKIIAWRHIQETIKQLSERLRKDLTGNTRVNFLAPLVGPIYTLHQAHRQKLTEYGHTLSGANNNSRPSLADIARSVREAESASSTPVVAETVGEAPAIPAEDGPAVDEVAAVARAVREGETSNEQSAREAEALDLAREANQNEKDGINPWLEEAAKESGPSETGQALSELLGGKQAEQREK